MHVRQRPAAVHVTRDRGGQIFARVRAVDVRYHAVASTNSISILGNYVAVAVPVRVSGECLEMQRIC